MKKTKKALASLAIAGMTLSMIPFNAFAATTTTRIMGMTAEQTAVKIADQTGYTGTAILASSTSYGMVDALTAGPLAASLKAPILLTGAGNTLNADTKAELTKLAVKKVYVTSGTAVIKAGVIDELKAMGIEVVALGGFDRAETSVNIAKQMTGVTKVAVANGVPDALSIASVASAANQPILLTNKDMLPTSVADYLATAGVTSTDVIGGTGVISDAVVAGLPGATRHFGMTAYDTNNQVIQDFAAALEFDNIYVANGQTGIDALAGAPLAAQTKSAIVLTDGKTVPQAAAFTYSKSSTSSVVTALGGEAVVPESVRAGVAAGAVTPDANELKIASVSALDDTNRFLEISFSKAVAGLETSDITVQNADTLARYGVKEVRLSSNGLTATVELFAREDATAVLAYLQDYTVTVYANGTMLKAAFNRPAYVKERITEIDPSDAKFKVGGVTVNVPANVKFDYADALGRDARVWYDKDRDLVSYAATTETVVEGSIEVTDTRSGSEYGEIEVDGDDSYDLAEDFDFYLNDDKVSIGSQDSEYDYAKIFFDKSGDVELIVAYNWDDFFVVKDVDGDAVISYDDDELDIEDYRLFKGGKQISVSDLDEGDMLFFQNNANNDDGVAEVYNKTVTGEIENVYLEEIEVDGKTYKYAGLTRWLDDDDFKTLTTKDAEKFQAGGDVTLFLNRAGDLVYITGAQEDVASNTIAAHLTEDIVAYNTTGIADRGVIELELVNEDNDEMSYELKVNSLDVITVAGVEYEVDEVPAGKTQEIDEFQLSSDKTKIEYVLKNGGGRGTVVNLASYGLDNDVVELVLDDNGKIEELGFLTSHAITSDLELDDTYVKANGKSYKLKSDTVVFNGSEGFDGSTYDPDSDEIDVNTWSELKNKGYKIEAGKVYVDGNNVEYLVISETDAEDFTNENAIVTKVLRNTDSEVVSITAYVNGEKKTFTVDEVKSAFTATIIKGSAVVLKVNDDSGEVENIIAPTTANQVVGEIDELKVADKKVKLVGDANWYSLVSDGYVLDATDTSDITKEVFRDLSEGDLVVIQLDEANSIFAEAIVIVDELPGVEDPGDEEGDVVTASFTLVQNDIQLLNLDQYSADITVNDATVTTLEFVDNSGELTEPATASVVNGKVVIAEFFTDSAATSVTITAKNASGAVVGTPVVVTF